ncbi:hypothetical protein AB7M16_004984 [Bradyrhizobium sp. USDA 372]|uniref:Transposase C of IS166 homeodomain-containing protein n=1 Tax=Bradyrhizobium yuanmingense TaxID=108015 RepID=A0A1C3XMK1_9BRAD|nr:transposase IS166 family protein [Bradyrhizobium yuanmingense]SCB53375.1 Transposase C of IS166 homeodomain-containing protein [Bradyrhizobium yuanmingense]
MESEIDDLKARNADARIARLTQILKAFDRPRFDRRSEKLGSASIDDEQQAFAFEEIETGIAAIRTQVNKGRERGGWQTRTSSAQGLCIASGTDRGCHRAGSVS